MISVRDLKRETGLKKNVSLELRFKEIEGYKILSPVFIDIDPKTLNICPNNLQNWLQKNAEIKNGKT
ncbi:hypothetical protein GX420_02355, partial [bacterium]|nr:hypothetical protein [bacterium]